MDYVCPLQVLFHVHAAQTQAQLPAIQQPGKVVVRLVNHPQGRRLISQVCPGPSCSSCGTAQAVQPLLLAHCTQYCKLPGVTHRRLPPACLFGRTDQGRCHRQAGQRVRHRGAGHGAHPGGYGHGVCVRQVRRGDAGGVPRRALHAARGLPHAWLPRPRAHAAAVVGRLHRLAAHLAAGGARCRASIMGPRAVPARKQRLLS